MAERTELATRMRMTDAPAERSADEIRQDIVSKRESITETVDKLGERIQESLDWREYAVRYPYLALGAAAGAGFVLSRLFRRRPSPRERIMDAIAEISEDFGGRLRHTVEDAAGRRRGPGHAVKGAIVAMATKSAVDLLSSRASEMLARQNAGGRQNQLDLEHSRAEGVMASDQKVQ